MKIKYFSFLFVFLVYTTNISVGSYLKSRVEMEIDEMGYMLKGEGATLRSINTKSRSAKAMIGNANKYLCQATLEVLTFVPLTLVDIVGGVITTEWYNPKGQHNTQFKINIFITDEAISSEALDVKVYERNKIGQKWSEDFKESAIARILKDKIIRKARTLYQAEK